MRKVISLIVLASIGACVSISPPRTGTDAPVTTPGRYKRGADQVVRIALATNARDGTIGATGAWLLASPDDASPIARPAGTDEWKLRFTGNCPAIGSGSGCEAVLLAPDGAPRTLSAPLLVRAAGPESFVKWNGKRYRGDLIITRADSGFLVANYVSMDSYLRGVVPLEIGVRTPAEFAAVQVQAVAARTYSYTRLTSSRAFDMYATVQDQVYGGVDAERPQTDSAITTTRDVVIAYAGRPINAFYSSTCGGSTAGVTEVWNDRPDEAYLRPVSDRIPGTNNYYCDPSPRFSWTQTWDGPALRAVMDKYLGNYTNAPKTGVGRITGLSETGRTASDRILALRVATETGTYDLRGNDTRFVLRNPQGTILNSTYFRHTTTTSGGEVTSLTVTGRGYGHGIGMCQWGAIGRARAGQDFRTILETYYQGARVGRIG
ncbi:MAG TPA: SpoIID/LytB domain-containing protein [Gemmatimonadaceae bacterium]|nr:SpoIID/LytB domain-containing protein [Gemmatimonadaceae bacterium]